MSAKVMTMFENPLLMAMFENPLLVRRDDVGYEQIHQCASTCTYGATAARRAPQPSRRVEKGRPTKKFPLISGPILSSKASDSALGEYAL